MYGRIPYLNNSLSSWATYCSNLRRLLYYTAVWLGTSPSVPLTNATASILKIKEAFPALPNKKILEIHDTAFPKPNNKGHRIQHTTRGLSRKQAIVPTSNNIIMGEANTHIFQINMLLKSIKSMTRAEFIHPCPGGVSININSVPNTSDLNTIERYLKSINGAGNNEVLAPQLP